MIVEDNNIAMSITYQLECAKTRKFPKPDPNPKIRVFWVLGRIILIPNPTRSTINIITMGSYLRWLSIYIFLLQTIHKMGFDAIERLQIVIKNYTNFSYRGICLPQCRTHTDCLKDQDCAEDGRCLHFCSWRQRKDCPNKTICDMYENRCLKPCKGQFLKIVLI